MKRDPAARYRAMARPVYAVSLLVTVIICAAIKFAPSYHHTAKHIYNDGERYRVMRVIDGDTVKLSNRERVRLIGIDTPEVYESEKLYRDASRSHKDIRAIQEMGRRASRFVKELIDGKTVRLEFDAQRRDRYGRLLAYLYLEDGTFVNARIVEEGYAKTYTIPPNVKYASLFSKLQGEARRQGRGLWKITP